jgi:hypothetical protein
VFDGGFDEPPFFFAAGATAGHELALFSAILCRTSALQVATELKEFGTLHRL